jgi:hypothetical protein
VDGRQKALTAAHLNRLALIQQTTADRLLRGWDSLGYYDSANADPFIAAAVPVVAGGQAIAAGAVAAYVAAYIGRQVPAPPLNKVTGAATRRGTDPAAVYRRPFEQVWWNLSEGVDPATAIARGRDLTARTDIQLAARATTAVLGVAAGATIAGWVRVADPGACDLCAAADGEELGPGDEFSIHPNCACGAAPLDQPPDPSADGSDPEAIDVHDHGELGPYLAAKGDGFSNL